MKTNPPTQYLVLKENHPTMVKFNKLYDLAEELGIKISFSIGICIIQDRGIPHLFEVRDVEDYHGITSFPHGMETKIVYENPEYVAYRAQEQKEYEEKVAAEKLAKAERDEALRIKWATAAKERQEMHEKAQLRVLIAKYGTEGY